MIEISRLSDAQLPLVLIKDIERELCLHVDVASPAPIGGAGLIPALPCKRCFFIFSISSGLWHDHFEEAPSHPISTIDRGVGRPRLSTAS